MTDIAEFLLARIAEDEKAAAEAGGDGWEQADDRKVRWQRGNAHGWVAIADLPTAAAHIARHDPARVLAECEAKRRIVEAESNWRRTKGHVSETSMTKAPEEWVNVTWIDDTGRPHNERVRHAEFRERFTEPSPPSSTLKLLALPYADHPEYDRAWRP